MNTSRHLYGLSITVAVVIALSAATFALADTTEAADTRDNEASWKGTELLSPLPRDPEKRAAALRRVRELNSQKLGVGYISESTRLMRTAPVSPVDVLRSRTYDPLASIKPRDASRTNAPGLLTSFSGIPYNSAAPANPDIAAGPNHLIVTAGDEFSVYDKCGALRDGGDINTYFPVPSNIQFSDGRVIYDDWDNRWVMSFVGNTFAGAAFVYVFVTNNSNPLSGWYFYAFTVTLSTEYPQGLHIAVDPDFLYLTYDHINLSGTFIADASIAYGDKSNLYSNSPVTLTSFSGFSHLNDFIPAFGIRPSQLRSYDGNMYFLGTNIDGGGEVNIRRILDPMGTPSVVNSVVSVPAYGTPPNGQQMDLTYIEAGDARFTDVVYFNGVVYSTGLREVGGVPQAYIQMIDPATPAHITRYSTTGAAGPAIDVDGDGAVSLVVAGHSTGSNPTSRYVTVRPTPLEVYDNGFLDFSQGSYQQGGFGTDVFPYQLADYFGAALDPTDRRTVWLHGVSSSSSPAGTWKSTVGAVSRAGESVLTASVDPVALAGPAGGPYNSDRFTFTLTNTGQTTANWKLDSAPSWLSPGATSGFLTPGAFQEVTFFLNAAAYALPPGVNSPTVTFTNCTGSGAPPVTVTIGVADTIDCSSALVDLRGEPPLMGTSMTGVTRGVFITAIEDMTVCAIGFDHSFPGIAQSYTVDIYEASGDVRGALVATMTNVVVDTGLVEHFTPINAQLGACQDYEIVATTGATGEWNVWTGQTLPYDVGGVIRVRNGQIGGAPNPVLPGFTVIANCGGCAGVADLDPGSTIYTTSLAAEGVNVVPTQNVRTCAIGFEADLTPGARVNALVYKANGGILGTLVGIGTFEVTTSGMTTHSIPLNAALFAGQEYEILWTHEGTGSWRYFDSSEFTFPFTESPFDVTPSQVSGGPSTRMPHTTIHWDDYFGGAAFDLAKAGGAIPPPFTNGPGSLENGAYVQLSTISQVYGIGVMADIPVGEIITANIYEANAGSRGPLLATGSSVSTSAGSQWYDVPIAFTTKIGDQYDVEVTCSSVNDFRYWDDTTGLPYSLYGIISVNDGVSGGDPAQTELIHMRLHMCDQLASQVSSKRTTTPMFMSPPSPNPSFGSVTLGYNLEEPDVADMAVYDVRGRKVAEVFTGRSLTNGDGTVQFNTRTLPAGVYFVRLQTRTAAVTRKLVVMR